MAVDKILGYAGIGEDCATFTVASDTTAAVGMAVAITGANEVGKGSEGNALFGVIKNVQSNGLVTVQFKGFVEGVAITATSAKQPAAGSVVAVDGAGALVKLDTLAVATTTAAVVAFGGVATAVDTTAKTATVLIK